MPENQAAYEARRAAAYQRQVAEARARGEPIPPPPAHEDVIPPAQWVDAGVAAGTNVPFLAGAHLPGDLVTAMRDDPVNAGILAMSAGAMAYGDQFAREAGVLPPGGERQMVGSVAPGVNAYNDNRGAYDPRTGTSAPGQYHVNSGQILMSALYRLAQRPVRLPNGQTTTLQAVTEAKGDTIWDLRRSRLFPSYVARLIVEQAAHESPHDLVKDHSVVHENLTAGFMNTMVAHYQQVLPVVEQWHASGALDNTLQTYGRLLQASSENPTWQARGNEPVAALEQ